MRMWVFHNIFTKFKLYELKCMLVQSHFVIYLMCVLTSFRTCGGTGSIVRSEQPTGEMSLANPHLPRVLQGSNVFSHFVHVQGIVVMVGVVMVEVTKFNPTNQLGRRRTTVNGLWTAKDLHTPHLDTILWIRME